MVEEMKALWWENKALRQKTLNSGENEHIEGGEHSTKGSNADEVD